MASTKEMEPPRQSAQPESWPEELVASLATADSPQAFMDALFSYKGRLPGHRSRLSFAGVSRKAGLKSRSYLREVVRTGKILRPDVATRVARALRIPGEFQSILLYLAERGARTPSVEVEDPRAELERLRSRLRERHLPAFRQEASTLVSEVLKVPNWLVFVNSIHRAGSATAALLSERIGIPEKEVARSLEILSSKGIVEKGTDGAYRVLPFDFNMTGLGTTESFQKQFDLSLERARAGAAAEPSSPERLLFFAVASVRRSDLPELKSSLRETLHRFLDRAHVAEGDATLEICVSSGPYVNLKF